MNETACWPLRFGPPGIPAPLRPSCGAVRRLGAHGPTLAERGKTDYHCPLHCGLSDTWRSALPLLGCGCASVALTHAPRAGTLAEVFDTRYFEPSMRHSMCSDDRWNPIAAEPVAHGAVLYSEQVDPRSPPGRRVPAGVCRLMPHACWLVTRCGRGDDADAQCTSAWRCMDRLFA